MFLLGGSGCLVMKVEKVNKEIRSKGGGNPKVTCPTNTNTHTETFCVSQKRRTLVLAVDHHYLAPAGWEGGRLGYAFVVCTYLPHVETLMCKLSA